jgi:hypothetical protein
MKRQFGFVGKKFGNSPAFCRFLMLNSKGQRMNGAVRRALARQ